MCVCGGASEVCKGHVEGVWGLGERAWGACEEPGESGGRVEECQDTWGPRGAHGGLGGPVARGGVWRTWGPHRSRQWLLHSVITVSR